MGSVKKNHGGHFNMLTPAQLELLACLAEECGEIVQIVGKIIRHGYGDWSPADETMTTNRSNLERELGDLSMLVLALEKAGDIDHFAVQTARMAKGKKLPKWTHHQPDSELSSVNPAIAAQEKGAGE